MNVLIIGGGGREHALAWKINQSDSCDNLFVAPGNAGTSQVAKNIALKVDDFKGIADFCLAEQIELIIVGPEDPLVKGIVDYFKSNNDLKHIKVFGPDAAGAELEGSKEYAKEFMFRHDIPTAGYKTFYKENLQDGLDFIDTIEGNIVLKADGLAAGKGVIITDDKAHAKTTLEEMIMHAKFGDASSKVVIEEFLDGVELSVFVITDGKNYTTLPEAKDYKRIGEGNTGLNTGGMGALTPVPFADEAYMDLIDRTVIKPTIDGLAKDGIEYRGFIFFGLINVEGTPKVIEYNVRMGDPETEAVMLRVDGDILKAIDGAFDGSLNKGSLGIKKEAASTVMLVAGGYPEAYEKGNAIAGLEDVKDVIAFHAGTTTSSNGEVVTNGGRVIAMSASGATLEEALAKSNAAAKSVTWKDRYFRTDLGFDIL